MSEELIVARLHDDHLDLMEYLRTQGEVSFLATMESAVPKVILLAAASDLESRVGQLIRNYVASQTGSNEFVVNFVMNKAVNRQFHTFFNWKDRSAAPFFGLFGERFKEKMKVECRDDESLAKSIRDFCEVGALRNQLVHESYASFTLEKTSQEVFDLYRSALVFVARLPGLLTPPTSVAEVVQ
jgi:hypothetical protein